MLKRQKQKVKIKNIKHYVPIISIFCVFAISGIVAYLMDSDAKINKFILGNVDIVLHEDNWNPTIDTDGDQVLDAVKIRVGQTVDKDPQIENTGDTDAFVYLKLYIPKGTYEDGLSTVSNDSIISYQIDTENWEELEGARCSEGENNIYVYCYKNVLPPSDGENPSITPPLFNNITLKTVPDGDEEEKIVSVKVEAYAMDTLNVLDGTTYDKTEMAIDFIEEANGKRQNIVTTTKVSLADCEVTPQDIEIYKNENETIEINKINEDLNPVEELVYTSSDYNVANVNQLGIVTGVKPGNAVITVTGKRSGVAKTVDITVLYKTVNSSEITVADYGKYVNLGTDLINKNTALEDNTTPLTDWRIFKADSSGTWLILADYLPQSKMTYLNTGLNMLSGKTYNVNHSTDRDSLLAALRNEIAWKSLLNDTTLVSNSDVIVKGALTVQEWVDSWNANAGYTNITISGSEEGGYKLNNSNNINLEGNIGYLNTLYFPHKSSLLGCNAYWLDAPLAGDTRYVIGVPHHGNVDPGPYNDAYRGVRPVVYLPSSIEFDDENEIWILAE